MSTETQEYDLIVVGAGIAGSAAAKAFAQDGRKVLLLERDLSEPDRIVGELLQPGGVRALKELGMEDALNGIDAIPCYGYGVIRNGVPVHIPYTPLDKAVDPQKQATGATFHHGRFIQGLRRIATAQEGVTVIEATATSLIYDNDEAASKVIGVNYNVKSTTLADDQGQSVTDNKAASLSTATTEHRAFAPLTIVADGLFSRFRKEVIPLTPKVKSNFVGFILHDCPLPFPNHGHVILARPSPILMYQIGSRETRVLIDIPGKLLNVGNGDLKKYFEDIVVPQIPEKIRPSFINALETQRPRSMPNGFLPPKSYELPGFILLGDALNMRHPLTGGGMTVALNDVCTLRGLLSPTNVPSFTTCEDVLCQLQVFHWQRKSYCTSINVLAMALYTLFAAGDDPALVALQEGCFGYFQLGGNCVEGPVGLLSALIQRPAVLVYHFFAVAFYSIYLMFKRAPTLMERIKCVGFSGVVIWRACVVILPFLWSEVYC